MATPWTFTPTDGSYPAITLIVLADGVPREATPDMSLRHIPGSAVWYIDRAGPGLPTLDVSARFDVAADALAAEAAQGQPGTLVGALADIGGASGHVPAILNTVRRTSRGLHTQGPIVLTVQFILTGAAS